MTKDLDRYEILKAIKHLIFSSMKDPFLAVICMLSFLKGLGLPIVKQLILKTFNIQRYKSTNDLDNAVLYNFHSTGEAIHKEL